MDNDFDPTSALPLSDQVVNWLLLLRSGRATPHDYANFLAWRDADPSHENAWQQLTNALGTPSPGRLSDAYPLAPVPQASGSASADDMPPPSPSRRRLLGGAVTLGACAMGGIYFAVPDLQPGSVRADATTATGERRRYALADGSKLLLDARSRVKFEFTSAYRLVHLLDGALSIDVAQDSARPFLVQTAEGVTRTVGTAPARYMVRQQPHRTLVVVHQQHVDIENTSGLHATAPAGSGMRFGAALLGRLRPSLLNAAAWEHGWIEANGSTLAEVVAALRPYYPGALRVSMAAGGLPVHGRYPLDQPEEALRALEQSVPIRVDRYTPWFVSIGVFQA